MVEVGEQVETEEWPGHESKKEGKWKIKNMKKRKREGEEGSIICSKVEKQVQEFDQAEPVMAEPSVARIGDEFGNNNSRKKRKFEKECGTAELDKTKLGVAIESEPNIECGQTKTSMTEQGVSGMKKTGTERGKRALQSTGPECGKVQLENTELCQVLDKIELCHNLVTEVVERVEVCGSLTLVIVESAIAKIRLANNKPGHTQVKMDEFITRSIKRKLGNGNITQPSVQPRKRRRKVEENLTTAAKSNHEHAINIFNEKMKILPKTKNNTNIKTFKGGKSKKNMKEHNIQKTKITSFFEPSQTKKTGLAAGGGVDQCHIQQKLNSNSQQLEISSEVGGVGRRNPGADKGVGDRLVTFSFTTSKIPAQRRPSGLDCL